MTRAFLPGIGFREAGVRLLAPVAQRAANGRRLTVTELVSSRDGSDLVYEIEWHGEQDIHIEGDRIVLHGASTDPACRPGGMNVAVRAGRLVSTRTLPPVADGVTRVEVEIAGDAGEWKIPLELEPFGDEQQVGRELDASATRDAITVFVDSIVRTSDALVLELRAYTSRDRGQVALGGLQGLRDNTTALRLRDGDGRTFVEEARQDARDQLPGHLAGSDVAIFRDVPVEGPDLRLEVPYVSTTEYDAATPAVDVPILRPAVIDLGGTRLVMVGSHPAELASGRGAAIQIDFEPRSWDHDWRVIAPLQATLDGGACGMSWVGGIYAPAPEPVAAVLIPCATPLEPHTVSLRGAYIQHRGPWEIDIGPRL